MDGGKQIFDLSLANTLAYSAKAMMALKKAIVFLLVSCFELSFKFVINRGTRWCNSPNFFRLMSDKHTSLSCQSNNGI